MVTARQELDLKPVPPEPRERIVSPRDKEIEAIKRTLYNAIDKLDRMQRRDAELITT